MGMSNDAARRDDKQPGASTIAELTSWGRVHDGLRMPCSPERGNGRSGMECAKPASVGAGRGTILRTEHLLLRPFREDDVDAALSYRDDEEFSRFLPHIPQPFTRRDAEEFVATNMSEPWDRAPTFAVVLDGTVIGTVNLQVESATRSAMLGYAIGREHWGQGVATEAARAVVAWGFRTFDLVRVWASTDARNVRSQRVMEKVGMRREDVRRGHHLGRDGQPVDEVVYAVGREEWSAIALPGLGANRSSTETGQ